LNDFPLLLGDQEKLSLGQTKFFSKRYGTKGRFSFFYPTQSFMFLLERPHGPHLPNFSFKKYFDVPDGPSWDQNGDQNPLKNRNITKILSPALRLAFGAPKVPQTSFATVFGWTFHDF